MLVIARAFWSTVLASNDCTFFSSIFSLIFTKLYVRKLPSCYRRPQRCAAWNEKSKEDHLLKSSELVPHCPLPPPSGNKALIAALLPFTILPLNLSSLCLAGGCRVGESTNDSKIAWSFLLTVCLFYDQHYFRCVIELSLFIPSLHVLIICFIILQ
jgi:hypothetical protein